MEFRKLATMLRKWLWLIVLCATVAGAAAYVVSNSSEKIYQASATLMINESTSPGSTADYSDIMASMRLAQTYANLLTSRPVLEETAARLGLTMPVTDLAGSITVTQVRDTQLLAIYVNGPDPDLITQIANTLPEVFIERNREMQVGRIIEARTTLEEEISGTLDEITRTYRDLLAATDDTLRLWLQTNLAQLSSTYTSLVASVQQAKLVEAQTIDNVVITEPAIVPRTPIRPRATTDALLAAAVGAMIAMAVAVLIEYLDDTVKTPEDVRRASGLSTLGTIARRKDAGAAHEPIAWLRTTAPESEAYRTLRTNIQFTSVDRPMRTMLITSSSPGEGKSTTAASLAVVLAQTGQRVILVDADLRHPVQHKLFGVPNSAGLTTALLSGENIVPEGHLQPTEIESLRILTSGPVPPNPSELLGSQRMARLTAALASQADIVIFDSPPVLAVTDAAVLGRQVDGAVLVADSGSTREHALATAANELCKTGTNVLGVTLNRLDTRRGGYYDYHNYYAGEGDRRRRPGPENGSEPKR